MIAGLRRRAERDHDAILGAVDASLQDLPPRRQLTGDEAYRVLFDLDTFLAELAAGSEDERTSEARAVVAESLRSLDGWTVVDRGRVEDPLLDVRNLVAPANR
ncbi:MAG: hypothetical protein JNK12_14105 [Acidimicrobiales bacterium]|nr:hypothetical protein [Acidimicrobiales bacterium]